ncbi:MAG TPA: M28 family peptidase [Gemmatimonadales bacterium]|nr:M28 family peptidase [Gemmatimonadales bacterium]
MDLGFAVEVQPFHCTAAALVPLPLLGAGLGGLGLVLVPPLVLSGPPPWLAAALWAGGVVSLGLLATGAALGHVPAAWAGTTRKDANLIATRTPTVRRWIVAHLDTKAQGHSMAGRLVAVWLLLVAAALLTALAALRLGGPVPMGAAGAAAATAVVAGALAGRGRLRGRTAGARDNGSGVVAAITAAGAADDLEIGILITGAEELGLVGARAFAAERRDALAGVEVINLDTIDQRGPLWVVSHDARGDVLAEREAAKLARLGLAVRRRRLPVGVLTDSLALARAGASAITIARLDWRTLRTIHTPADTLEGLALDTALAVGRTVAG